MGWGNLLRVIGDSLFWVKSFVLRRLKKPPDLIQWCDVPETIELVTCFPMTMGIFNLAKKIPNLLMRVTLQVISHCFTVVWLLAALFLKVILDRMVWTLVYLLAKQVLWVYLLKLEVRDVLFPV